MNASHILVKQLFEIEDISRALAEGKSFESLARKFSQCPSSELGGWLGNMNKPSVDRDFYNCLLSLKINEISAPLRTKFGFHLIRREED